MTTQATATTTTATVKCAYCDDNEVQPDNVTCTFSYCSECAHQYRPELKITDGAIEGADGACFEWEDAIDVHSYEESALDMDLCRFRDGSEWGLSPDGITVDFGRSDVNGLKFDSVEVTMSLDRIFQIGDPNGVRELFAWGLMGSEPTERNSLLSHLSFEGIRFTVPGTGATEKVSTFLGTHPTLRGTPNINPEGEMVVEVRRAPAGTVFEPSDFADLVQLFQGDHYTPTLIGEIAIVSPI